MKEIASCLDGGVTVGSPHHNEADSVPDVIDEEQNSSILIGSSSTSLTMPKQFNFARNWRKKIAPLLDDIHVRRGSLDVECGTVKGQGKDACRGISRGADVTRLRRFAGHSAESCIPT